MAQLHVSPEAAHWMSALPRVEKVSKSQLEATTS
jgi:hypothetical protein